MDIESLEETLARIGAESNFGQPLHPTFTPEQARAAGASKRWIAKHLAWDGLIHFVDGIAIVPDR